MESIQTFPPSCLAPFGLKFSKLSSWPYLTRARENTISYPRSNGNNFNGTPVVPVVYYRFTFVFFFLSSFFPTYFLYLPVPSATQNSAQVNATLLLKPPRTHCAPAWSWRVLAKSRPKTIPKENATTERRESRPKKMESIVSFCKTRTVCMRQITSGCTEKKKPFCFSGIRIKMLRFQLNVNVF